MKVDFKKFERSLPYASEMYGVYQPLLGWKSGRVRQRTIEGIVQSWPNATANLRSKMQPHYTIGHVFDPREVEFEIEPARPTATSGRVLLQGFDSIIARRIAKEIAAHDAVKPDVWHRFTSKDVVRQLLNESSDEIRQEYAQTLASSVKAPACSPRSSLSTAPAAMMMTRTQPDYSPESVLSAILERESAVAGLLTQLNEKSRPDELMRVLQAPIRAEDVSSLLDAFLWVEQPPNRAAGAVLSPIGVVHLFRQYFFEFDSFLGPPVQHLWLSPGGSVELVEVSTRKQIVERMIEQTLETIEKSETSTMEQDELSDAVKSENESNTKLGVSLNTSTSFGVGKMFTSQVNTGTSFDMDQAQKEAREHTHKGLRQQTQKISSEVRNSYKSSFRTVTETTDVNSKRYVIQNTGKQLLNYELRRKMRQVGVQVQDYGTQLCWQTYVDQPGDDLGVARLVHIAEPSDLTQAHNPKEIPQPEPMLAGKAVPKTAKWEWADNESSPKGGLFPLFGEVQVGLPPKDGYIFSEASIFPVPGAPPWDYRWRPSKQIEIDKGNGTTETSIQSIEVGVYTETGIGDPTRPTISVELTPYYVPSSALKKRIDAENRESKANATKEEERIYKETLFKEARDRIKLASKVHPRKSEELREEERIVIYRKLIRQLLEAAGLEQPDPKLRHVFAELVQMMFDVDRMLYFVAPEWWVPRERPARIYDAGLGYLGTTAHRSPQDIGIKGNKFASEFELKTTSWGGTNEDRPDNYYITEDSDSARLGSSLGWLIQLDGDNLRNAFLNAPWVKAVIPIRPDREWEALDWLESPNIEGSDGLDLLYQASNAERDKILKTLKGGDWSEHPALKKRYSDALLKANDLTIRDAIHYLIVRIQANQAAATKKIPDPAEPGLSYLPTDMVYEHGFDPLEGGFQAQPKQLDPQTGLPRPFRVFDQWIEVLPTDQIVPVEVEYDPKTGIMKDS